MWRDMTWPRLNVTWQMATLAGSGRIVSVRTNAQSSFTWRSSWTLQQRELSSTTGCWPGVLWWWQGVFSKGRRKSGNDMLMQHANVHLSLIWTRLRNAYWLRSLGHNEFCLWPDWEAAFVRRRWSLSAVPDQQQPQQQPQQQQQGQSSETLSVLHIGAFLFRIAKTLPMIIRIRGAPTEQ